MMSSIVSADTIEKAFGQAYANNPTLNAQRATLRATDELVPQGRAGYMPKISGSADASPTQNWYRYKSEATGNVFPSNSNYIARGVGLQVDQTLFNGFRTDNTVRQAESKVLAARETLRNTEQNVLLDSITAYMNVLRDTAIYTLRQNNIEVLQEQVRQTTDRFNVGEVTRTDVAQSQSRRAGAEYEATLAKSNLKTSLAKYRQTIGVEPKRLESVKPITKLLPKTREQALALALRQHPVIVATLHGADAQQLQIKVVEGELYPTLSASASLARRRESNTKDTDSFIASAGVRLSVPIYEGGQVYSRVREAKETLTEKRLQVDVSRDQVQAAVVTSWGQYEAATAQIQSGQAQVKAAEIALAGVREEARVGQRTTLDVLNAQQELLNARVNLISAQRDQVVSSYGALSSIGKLSVAALGIKTQRYDEKIHYEQVRDKWIGLRTPDGQ